MPKNPEQTETGPGADRFWGQFSQSRAGRTDSNTETGTSGKHEPGSGDDETARHAEGCLEWCPICRSAELFRHTVSPELKQQAESIQHEALGVFKAFLDAYAEKSSGTGASSNQQPPRQDPSEPAAPRVTDIPLE